MYQKDFIPLKNEDIKRVNASALAKQFECTSMWIGKVMRLQEWPENEKSQRILMAAREIINGYESQSNT